MSRKYFHPYCTKRRSKSRLE